MERASANATPGPRTFRANQLAIAVGHRVNSARSCELVKSRQAGPGLNASMRPLASRSMNRRSMDWLASGSALLPELKCS